jgi:hypothetical protein
MKHVPTVAVLLAASSASAAPYALDYAASDPSCIDAARFSDEVSAKVGFVPWDPAAAAKIRIRVERDSGGFTGTFRNADGSAKVIDGASCSDVIETLVVTVATAVDKAPTASVAPVALSPTPGPGIAGNLIPVAFESTEGRRISISLQKARGLGVASNGAAVAAVYFDNVCTSPCSAGLPQGRNLLTFSDPDDKVYGEGRFIIDRPTTFSLTRESRRGTRITMIVAGAALTALGAYGMSQIGGGGTDPGDSHVLAITGGTLGLIFGSSAVVSGLFFVHDTFAVTQRP